MITVTLLGRISSMKELITTQNEKKVLNFSVVNNRYSGTEQIPDFFNVVAWDATAQFVEKYFKVGQFIMISGTIINDTYEKDNVKYYNQKIVATHVEFAGYNKSDISEKE